MSDVLSKIEKLMRLALGTSEHEARTAALLAVKLINEHKVQLLLPGGAPKPNPFAGFAGSPDMADIFNIYAAREAGQAKARAAAERHRQQAFIREQEVLREELRKKQAAPATKRPVPQEPPDYVYYTPPRGPAPAQDEPHAVMVNGRRHVVERLSRNDWCPICGKQISAGTPVYYADMGVSVGYRHIGCSLPHETHAVLDEE